MICPLDGRPCVRPRCLICTHTGEPPMHFTTPELAGLAELLHEKLQRTKPFAGEHPDIFLLRTNHWRVLLRKIAEEYDTRTDKALREDGQ